MHLRPGDRIVRGVGRRVVGARVPGLVDEGFVVAQVNGKVSLTAPASLRAARSGDA